MSSALGIFKILFLIIAIATTVSASAYIGECYLTNSDDPTRPDDGEQLTFVCVQDFKAINFFDASPTSRCSEIKSEFQKNHIEQINFEHCSMSNIGYQIFEVFKSVRTLNATNLGLGPSFPLQLFREAKNITKLLLSHNKIVELPSFLFVNATKLIEADFSFNQINAIDALAFVNNPTMQILNLAYNNITALHGQFSKYLLNLKSLNVSHNVITTLLEHTFDQMNQLEILDLSFNLIDELSTQIFASLTKLKHLNLSHANLWEIKSKTFSRLEVLQTLDLSHNKLKVLDVRALDAGIFLPRFDHLERLYIGANQLKELNGFSSDRFPILKFIGIADNKFECCYLMKLFRLICWRQLDLPFDVNSNHPNVSDSTGAKCDFTNGSENESLDVNELTWTEALSVISVLLIALLFVMVISIMKRNQHFRVNNTSENMTVQCDSISNRSNTMNVYDVPKFQN